MSSKQSTKKRGKINPVACDKCKRDKKKCDGSYQKQKPCKYCCDRNECCEYTEPNRLRVSRTQSDTQDNDLMLVSSNINDTINYPRFPESDLIIQLITDPSTPNEQTIILKRLYNEITRNPESPKLVGNKLDELYIKLKLLSSSTDNDNTKIQIWDDLCSLVNELDDDKVLKSDNNSTILDLFNSWNPETLEFSSNIHNTNIVSTTQQNLSFSNDQLDMITTTQQSRVDKPVLINQKIKAIKESKKTDNTKKRKTRKNQRGNKRTQPYPAGGQIVIRPSKQPHTMIWHQSDPVDDVPIMSYQIQPQTPPTPPPATRPPQRTQFQQQPLPPFTHFQSVLPINLWDHSTTMTMLSPKQSPTFSELEINNETTKNPILLSPTPSLHDDIIIHSPSNSSIDHVRAISDDEKGQFGLINLAPTSSTNSPQSPESLLTVVEEFIEMWPNYPNVTEDLSVVEPIWNC